MSSKWREGKGGSVKANQCKEHLVWRYSLDCKIRWLSVLCWNQTKQAPRFPITTTTVLKKSHRYEVCAHLIGWSQGYWSWGRKDWLTKEVTATSSGSPSHAYQQNVRPPGLTQINTSLNFLNTLCLTGSFQKNYSISSPQLYLPGWHLILGRRYRKLGTGRQPCW